MNTKVRKKGGIRVQMLGGETEERKKRGREASNKQEGKDGTNGRDRGEGRRTVLHIEKRKEDERKVISRKEELDCTFEGRDDKEEEEGGRGAGFK